MKNFAMTTALVAVLSVSALPAFAQDAQQIPTIAADQNAQDTATVNFVTGGIGDDERQAIESSRASYNTFITSSSVDGAFVENTQVVIHKKGGAEVLNVAAGPLLYVQLAPGTYVLDASHGGETKHQTITIGGKKAKSSTVHLSWKVPATVAGDQ